MKCQSCGQAKARVHTIESNLIKGMNLIMCTECKNKGFEPRFIIVLASASNIDISNYVANRLYHGDTLQAHEVIHSL